VGGGGFPLLDLDALPLVIQSTGLPMQAQWMRGVGSLDP
jgi:hypothetical protein